MNYLHKRKVLHLDLKPQNVLVDNDYKVKVADFGISRILSKEKASNPSPQGTIPCSVTNIGTILYMDNDMIYNSTCGPHSDVFSFGITLFEVLYIREHPTVNFDIQDDLGYELIREPLFNNQDPLIPPWWDEVIHALITSCLQNEHQKRPNFEKIIEILETLTVLFIFCS